MPYSLNKTNGIRLTIVQDGSIDTTTDLTFVGKNYTGYGSPVNENFLKLLENFANGTAPKKPLAGQLWFDTNNRQLKLYDGRKFKGIGIIEAGTQRSTGMNAGDLHFDTSVKKLFAFDGTEWLAIGPTDFVATGNGLSQTIVLDNNSNGHPAYVFTLDNTTSTIFSSDPDDYAIGSSSGYYNSFKRIYPGINLAGASTLGISSTSTTAGTLLWGTAASALGLVDGNNLIKAADLVRQSSLTAGVNYPMLVLNDDGITVGLQSVFQMHVTNSNIANLSAINGTQIKLNVKTNESNYTNILIVDGSSNYSLLPNPALRVNIGSSPNRFHNVYASTVTSSLFTGTTVSVNTVNANSLNINNATANSADIQSLTARNATIPSLNATTITATTITGTTIRGTNIFANAVYDNGSRVINEVTINNYGVRTIAGTTNQVNVSAATGNVTLSLPSNVTVTRLDASIVSGSELYDNGNRVLTLATIPSSGVTGIKGTSGEILVNDNITEVSGSVTLSLPSILNVDTVNASAVSVSGANVFTTYATGATGLTNVGTVPGQLQLGGTLNVAAGGTGKTTFSAGFVRASGTTAFTTTATIPWAVITGAPDSPIPAGTTMLFVQTNAPTGWTKVTSAAYNDAALRVVTGSTSTGGTVAFSAAFTSKSVSGTVGDTTLTVDQIPSHYHNTIKDNVFTTNSFPYGYDEVSGLPSGGLDSNNDAAYYVGRSSTVGGGQSHTHSFTGTAINLNVKYVDVIIATKD